MQVTKLHAHYQHAEQCSSHYTIQFWPHQVLAEFQKFEFGTSLDAAPVN